MLPMCLMYKQGSARHVTIPGSVPVEHSQCAIVFCMLQEPNILLSLGKPVGLIAAANIMVALHVLAGYQVLALIIKAHIRTVPAV